MSAKSGENIDTLLENIMLVSEVIISLIYLFDSDRNLSLSVLDECGDVSKPLLPVFYP